MTRPPPFLYHAIGVQTCNLGTQHLPLHVGGGRYAPMARVKLRHEYAYHVESSARTLKLRQDSGEFVSKGFVTLRKCLH